MCGLCVCSSNASMVSYASSIDQQHPAHAVPCHINESHHKDAATSLTPGFQRLNTAATPASVSFGVGGGVGGRRGGAASAVATGKGRGAVNNNRGTSAMVLETPPPSFASSVDGGDSSGGGGAVLPEALARKLRRLAGEALDKVCAGIVHTLGTPTRAIHTSNDRHFNQYTQSTHGSSDCMRARHSTPTSS